MNLNDLLQQIPDSRRLAFLANDPLSLPRRYVNREDREVAAFFSASLAYGRAAMIRRNLDDLFGRMPEGPAAFVRDFHPARDAERLAGFKHRFNDAGDMVALCWILRTMLEAAGSLENFFLRGDDGRGDIGPALISFVQRALICDMSPVCGQAGLPKQAGVRYFFPSPATGSACKRLCMFLRWVCRPDDGIDLGLWRGIDPARLVLPLDTHTARISRLIGLTGRNTPNWKMALEITERLRQFDPQDPVRFDFVLSHLGISEGCSGKKGTVCLSCPVAEHCLVAKGEGGR
ncbi:MAG: TIGR02757 family protein [Desulfuromonadaceae bacterium GWC2_58_13]|nr:MAG: TIGR02757 family protein [Desulfuromonadaceae bacterium GWC2_58_13]